MGDRWATAGRPLGDRWATAGRIKWQNIANMTMTMTVITMTRKTWYKSLIHENLKGFEVKSPTSVCVWKPSVFFFTLDCISYWNNHIFQLVWIFSGFCLSPTCHFAILVIYKFLDMNFFHLQIYKWISSPHIEYKRLSA